MCICSPRDMCHGIAFLSFSFSLSLPLILELCKSVAASAITDLRSKGALQQVRSWLRTILYELPWGHFGDSVNPRIVIGKFLTFSWDISSGTDGHDCDSANLESPRDYLLWIPISCESPFTQIYKFYEHLIEFLAVYQRILFSIKKY